MFRKIVLEVGAAALLSVAAWQHYVTAGIEDPPVCGEFAAGMVDEIPGGVGNASGTGLNYSTGFEPEEGFPLGYISNAGGVHPHGCGGIAFPCWGHTGSANASLITPTIESVNPASGVQHLRLIHDPSTRTNQTGFGIGVDARYPRQQDLSPRPVAPNTVSLDVAISNPGGMDFRIQPQSNSQGLPASFMLFYYDGSIWVYDNYCNTGPIEWVYTGAYWDTTGAYQNVTIAMNPCTPGPCGGDPSQSNPYPYGSTDFYYGGQLLYSTNVFAGTNLEQLLVFGDNYPGSHMDIDNVVLESLDEPPITCGNGIVEVCASYSPRDEECDTTQDAACPGRCIPPGEPGQCTCIPICTEADPCPVVNGTNGPFMSSSGHYVYNGNAPYISVDGCGSDFNAELILGTAQKDIITNNNCVRWNVNSDPSASCYAHCCVEEPDPCTCMENPGEPVLIKLSNRGYVPVGSTSIVNVRKKAACAGALVGACCDTNGPNQECTDNVAEADCTGPDKIWTDQGKCSDVSCDCIPDCIGATCGDDGCGGSCGTCDDGNVCNGLEFCRLDRTCQSGVPLVCDDGRDCSVDTCVEPAGTCEHDDSECFIPTVSDWGLIVLALVLLVAAKIRFARHCLTGAT